MTSSVQLVAVCVLAILPPTVAVGQTSFFDDGNRLYQQGEYRAALDNYLQILEAGLESGELHYNIGNAYFKLGELGQAILYYERAHRLLPRDADIQANLQLARSLTVDEITPLPGFWLFRVVRWWVYLVPRSTLVTIVVASYLVTMGVLVALVLGRRQALRRWARRCAFVTGAVTLVLGFNLAVIELGIGRLQQAIVLEDEVIVQSAPSGDTALELFTIHEGTKVRIDRTSAEWVEIVLEDGKVGWVRAEALESI